MIREALCGRELSSIKNELVSHSSSLGFENLILVAFFRCTSRDVVYAFSQHYPFPYKNVRSPKAIDFFDVLKTIVFPRSSPDESSSRIALCAGSLWRTRCQPFSVQGGGVFTVPKYTESPDKLRKATTHYWFLDVKPPPDSHLNKVSLNTIVSHTAARF
ncbi:hypothetical protein TNCV_1853921 [Trichonephila clavipes]|nr:hypothetical protein TNCV_1853921 [Trichonephila clavipes]